MVAMCVTKCYLECMQPCPDKYLRHLGSVYMPQLLLLLYSNIDVTYDTNAPIFHLYVFDNYDNLSNLKPCTTKVDNFWVSGAFRG